MHHIVLKTRLFGVVQLFVVKGERRQLHKLQPETEIEIRRQPMTSSSCKQLNWQSKSVRHRPPCTLNMMLFTLRKVSTCKVVRGRKLSSTLPKAIVPVSVSLVSIDIPSGLDATLGQDARQCLRSKSFRCRKRVRSPRWNAVSSWGSSHLESCSLVMEGGSA